MVEGHELLGRLGGQDHVLHHRLFRYAARLGLVGDLGLDQGGLHEAGADGVAGDAVLGHLEGDGLGQAHDAVLGRDIGRLERRGDQTVSRSDVDDPSAALLLHDRHGRLGGVEGRRQIDGDDQVPLVVREILDRGHVLDAGVIDQDVQLAELGLGLGHHVGDLSRLGHVGAMIEHLDAMLLGHLGAGALDGGHLAQAVHDDIDALGGERVGQGVADAAGRAGDDGDLPLQTEVHGHASAP